MPTTLLDSVTKIMGTSRKKFRGQTIYGMTIAGIKVAQLNVFLLELQLRVSLMISQIPVESANTRVGKSPISGVPPPLNLPMATMHPFRHPPYFVTSIVGSLEV